jgi:NADH-quinone oxidoreductase subunit B
MSLVSRISETMHNPAPVSVVDDILRPGDDNPLIQRGFATARSTTSSTGRAPARCGR